MPSLLDPQALSTDQGFPFKFRCERCGDGFMSSFQTNTIGMAGSLPPLCGPPGTFPVKLLFHKCRRCGNSERSLSELCRAVYWIVPVKGWVTRTGDELAWWCTIL